MTHVRRLYPVSKPFGRSRQLTVSTLRLVALLQLVGPVLAGCHGTMIVPPEDLSQVLNARSGSPTIRPVFEKHDSQVDKVLQENRAGLQGRGTLFLGGVSDSNSIASSSESANDEEYQQPSPTPSPYMPTWGIGAELGGAAIVGSITGHWYPYKLLVFEAGFLPFPHSVLVGGWIGARIGFRATDVQIWSIGVAGAVVSQESKEQADPGYEPHHVVLPRLAFEYVFPSQRRVLKIEAQLVRGNLLSALDTCWYPWGGVAGIHWF